MTEARLTLGGEEFRLGAVTADDRAEMLRLFATVFGAAPGDDWHAWKYGAGRGEAVGLWDAQGHLAAHYAGFPRDLVWAGTPVAATQIGDVMVAPRRRGLLMRRGPFYRVCETFFDTRVGAGRRFALAFGFPNERHIRLGENLGFYHDAGPIHALAWPTQNAEPGWRWRWTELAADDLPMLAGPAWTAMGADLADHVLGVRDATYLLWRFAARPDRDYRFFALQRRPLGGVAALAVMRMAPGEAELLDIVGPRMAFAPLLRGAVGEAFRHGAATLSAWASPAAASALLPTGATIAGRAAWLAVARASELRGAPDAAAIPWWWMGGDSDFR